MGTGVQITQPAAQPILGRFVDTRTSHPRGCEWSTADIVDTQSALHIDSNNAGPSSHAAQEPRQCFSLGNMEPMMRRMAHLVLTPSQPLVVLCGCCAVALLFNRVCN